MNFYTTAAVFTLLGLQVVTSRGAGNCEFPREWRGLWYWNQGEVTIHRRRMEPKGLCVESRDRSYILENRDLGCHECVQLLPRHHNLLQYRQSHCGARASLDIICAQIETTRLYTLVRANAVPISCPFNAGYLMKYNNNSGGMCDQPRSYVKPCASDRTLLFSFKHCPQTGFSYEKDMKLRCLAKWTQDRNKYMYAKMDGAGLENKTSYRCAIYEVFGPSVYMAMSNSATCRGISTAFDGPVVLEMTKDRDRWYDYGCVFPAWLKTTIWRDLSGELTYRITNNGEDILKTKHNHGDNVGTAVGSLRCIKAMPADARLTEFVGVSFTSTGCEAVKQCVRIKNFTSDIVMLEEGITGGWSLSHCDDSSFLNASKHLLYPEGQGGAECPIKHRHNVVDDNRGCFLEGNCHNERRLEFSKECSQGLQDLRLECVMRWFNGSKAYLIVQNTAHPTKMANCFEISQAKRTTRIAVSQDCNVGVSGILTRRTITVRKKAEKCIPRDTLPVLPSPTTERPPKVVIKHKPKEDEKDPQQTRTYTNSDPKNKGGFSFQTHPGNGNGAERMDCGIVFSLLVLALYLQGDWAAGYSL